MTASSERWRDASIGPAPIRRQATAAAERTTAFYTGGHRPDRDGRHLTGGHQPR